MSQLIENFIEMMSVERAATQNTLTSYRHDLNNLLRYLNRKKLTLEKVENASMRQFFREISKNGTRKS